MIDMKTLVLGAFATVSFSLTGYVLIPTLGVQNQGTTLEDGSPYPVPLSEKAALGREVYRDLGCMYCHTQQVRPNTFGVDLKRGWGRRGSLPVDYAGQSPPLLGTMRTGPDLADIGTRQPSDAWHYMHLYDPQLTSAGSNMPPFRFLFEEAQPGETGAHVITVENDRKVVPTERGEALVEYLKSLRQNPDVKGHYNE